MEEVILPQSWRDWKIVEKLGEGSYGRVYKAVKSDYLTSYSAIKIIDINYNKNDIDGIQSENNTFNCLKKYVENIVETFITEVKLMDRLKGETNIVSVEDYKIIKNDDGISQSIFIRMELLTPLKEYMSTRKINNEFVIKLGMDICRALIMCEENEIIHRDIKPENIFVNSNGNFKLGDFGVAKKLDNYTQNHTQKGTLNYMAPEVYNNEGYSYGADIYSLGIVLYKCLNNNMFPFIHSDEENLNLNYKKEAFARRIKGEELDEPINGSRLLKDIIIKATEFYEADRYSSAAEMMRELEKASKYINKNKGNRSFGKVALISSAVFIILAGAMYPISSFVLKYKTKDNGKIIEVVDENKDISKEESISLCLKKAKRYEKEGNLLEAINILKKERDKGNENDEIHSMYVNLCNTYAGQAIEEANKIADKGNYLEAIDYLGQCEKSVPGILSISSKKKQLESVYVSDVIYKANEYQENMDLTSAEYVISEALEKFPNNQDLLEEKNRLLGVN